MIAIHVSLEATDGNDDELKINHTQPTTIKPLGNLLPLTLSLPLSKEAMVQGCFSNPDRDFNSSTQMPLNLTTCIHQTQLCNSPVQLTLTWSKTLLSHSLTISSSRHFSITISLYPSTFSLFRTRPGSKSIHLIHHRRHYQKIKLHYDFTRAQFTHNSAEPDSGFYIAISCDSRVEFFLGDLRDELARRVGSTGFLRPTLLSKREHVFGRRSYTTRAHFSGTKHEIGIECAGGVLKVNVDGETKIVVKRLSWKFRGKERITVGGVEVDFYWDVFNWVSVNGGGHGHGVFVFQVGDGGVWPEMVGPEKRLMRKSSPVVGSMSPAASCSSVLQWAEESSDGGRSSCSSCTRSSSGSAEGGGGFTLLLYAWRGN